VNFVIPMAGRGDRFVKAGFNIPKMLIEAHGKTILEWSVDSLPIELCTNLIFIALKEHNDKYDLHRILDLKYGSKTNVRLITIEQVTRGQAETVLCAEKLLNKTKALVIFNIDTYFVSNTIKNSLLREDVNGVLGAFRSSESRFSFARMDESGYVRQTAEKIPISDYALTGLYHFSDSQAFIDVAKKRIRQNKTDKGEFYIAPMYNDLIQLGKKFIIDIANEHWILGTPEELEDFRSSFKFSI